jgi:hypothetical protein
MSSQAWWFMARSSSTQEAEAGGSQVPGKTVSQNKNKTKTKKQANKQKTFHVQATLSV